MAPSPMRGMLWPRRLRPESPKDQPGDGDRTQEAQPDIDDERQGVGLSRCEGWRFYRADTGNEPPAEKSDEAAIAAMTKFFHDGLAGLKQKAETK